MQGLTAARETTCLEIPGAGILEFLRDPRTGALLGISGAGRTYLTVDSTGTWHWEGICSTRDERVDDGVIRHVDTPFGSWRERYRWDEELLTEVDGVEIRRDDRGRVIACLPGGADPAPPDHRWFYGHDQRGLAYVSGPFGHRTIGRVADGRVISVTENGVHRPSPGHPVPPVSDDGDATGRPWVERDANGAVRHLFIWDGMRCLARVDGPVGAPLGAVFSLDPSATPVRIITPTGVIRMPRDAYGEGLLQHPSTPGLFGGRGHRTFIRLPLRSLDPRTGSFCDPDPWHGRDGDPRRDDGYEGPLPAEPAGISTYGVCRGDPVGRADSTGGVSVPLILSDLTWSYQNNMLSFFGIDWWFNLFGSLIMWPFLNAGGGPPKYDFFDTSGLVATDRHGGFGLRRDGLVNVITGGRAFTTSHIVWAPDGEYAELQGGEVIDPRGELELTHYGTILAVTPKGHRRELLWSMRPVGGAPWTTGQGATPWSRHGGVGVPVAPGTLTPWFPRGGLHLQTPLPTRHDTPCTMGELAPGEVAAGTIEPRTFLTAPATTGLAAGAPLLVEDSAGGIITSVAAVVASGTRQRIQLADDLGSLASTGLTVTELAAGPAASDTRAAGPVADSIDVHGTTAEISVGDLLRVVATGGQVTVARVAFLEARVPLDRPLPGDLAGPITVASGIVSAAALPVTVAGGDLDAGTGTRPAVGSTGLVSGGGSDVAVRVVAHVGTNGFSVDATLPPALAAASRIVYRAVVPGTPIGSRTEGPEPDAVLTYTPRVAGRAPDGGAALAVLRIDAGGTAHARLVPAPALHDVAVLDRPLTAPGPYSVERWAGTGRTIRGVTREEVVGLAVPGAASFAAAAAVFVAKTRGQPPAAGMTLLTGVDVRGGVAVASPATLPAELEPGRPVIVGSRVAAIRSVRATITFADARDLSASGLRLVELAPTGFRYLGSVEAPREILVQPLVDVAGTPVPADFSRFQVGDLVAITPAGGAVTWHRVVSVSGGRLALEDGPALPLGGGAIVQQVQTLDPGNGGPFLGIDGRPSGTGVTSAATFAVWSAALPAKGTPVGIIDGAVTRPTTVTSAPRRIEVTFGEPFDATGVTVATLAVDPNASRFMRTLARDGDILLLDGAASIAAPGDSVIAVAYRPTGGEVAGTVGPATLLVPESEVTEVDRGQALTEHELTHTLQYARWGPLWFNLFPMVAYELPGILATDAELPEYSPFMRATVSLAGGRWAVSIPDTAGVAIGVGDELQVVQNGQRVGLKVTAVAGAVYTATAITGTPAAGEANVRKKQSAGAFEIVHAVLDFLTHGGLVNFVAGSTWGGIFWLLGKAFYGLGRTVLGTGALHAATVESNGDAIRLSAASAASAIDATGRIVVRQGNDTIVRSMTRAGDLITLGERVDFTGGVQVAMYGTHDPESTFDWLSYHPAVVPDAANPFAVEVQDDLALSPEDRVVIRYRDNRPLNTDVLAVNGSRVELLDAIPITGGERSLRIARYGASDPLGNADSAAMTEMGMGWMRWVFDPYSQIDHAAGARSEWAGWLLRVMRWLLGTQSFSLPPGGYLWWGRLFELLVGPEYVTPIEQEASEQSGELYTPLGRVYGEGTRTGFGTYSAFVGDVVRYRYWPLPRDDRFDRQHDRSLPHLDSPGTHFSGLLRTLPNLSAAGAGTAPPNTTVTVDPSILDPGTYVAAAFTSRDPDPRRGGDTLGFPPSELGTIPVSARNERTLGTYAAFTRPGLHRLTTVNNTGRNVIPGAAEAVAAAQKQRQSLFFDIAVQDVEVAVAGLPVNPNAPGGTDQVTLVAFQQAEVAVSPNGPRTYRLSLPDPAGPSLTTDGGMRLMGRAPTVDPIPVEISRFYDVQDGAYGPGGLAFAGMHLSREVHVPVRRLRVSVTDTLPLRAAPEPTAAGMASLARGTGAFLLVPAPIVRPPRVTSVAGAPPPAGQAVAIARIDPSAAAARFLGMSGAAFRVSFPPNAATGTVVVTVTVGIGGATADLTSTFDLT